MINISQSNYVRDDSGFFIGKSSKLIFRKQYLENVCIFTSGSILKMSVQNRLFFSDQIN